MEHSEAIKKAARLAKEIREPVYVVDTWTPDGHDCATERQMALDLYYNTLEVVDVVHSDGSLES